MRQFYLTEHEVRDIQFLRNLAPAERAMVERLLAKLSDAPETSISIPALPSKVVPIRFAP